MSEIDELLSQVPIDQVARQLGVDPATAEQATRAALPALLGGMEANAQDPAGARSLAAAVGEHDSALLDGGVDLDQVDTSDGDKIVANVFGTNRDQVVNQLGGLGGKDGGNLMGKLLPMLAPIVLSYLAKRMTSGGKTGGADGGGGIADILGGMLGGGTGGSGGGLGGLGDLGGLGGLGDILGGLLGGGKR